MVLQIDHITVIKGEKTKLTVNTKEEEMRSSIELAMVE